MLLRHVARRVPLLAVAVLCATSAPVAAAVPSIVVGGRTVPVPGVVTVDEALQRAHVTVPAGRVLAAVSRRPVADDHRPGEVLVDGSPAVGGTRVRPGAVVTVVPGLDVTEPLQVSRVPVPPQGVASLYVGGTPGAERVVRGALSGETVTRTLVAPPRPGHLVAPGALALTFDDGPDPVWTPRVLDLLKAAHVHATFCLIGRQVARHPDLVRRIVKEGHALCNHTWSHDERLATRSAAVQQAELARTQEAVRQACGLTPRLFRAPGGRWSPGVVDEARRQGMTPLTWTTDPRDWARPGVARIVGVVLATARPGGVVLLHDGGGDRAQTWVSLRYLLARLPRLGYTFQVPVP